MNENKEKNITLQDVLRYLSDYKGVEVDQAISDAVEVVETLPDVGYEKPSTNKIYIVHKSDDDTYDCMYHFDPINNTWRELGAAVNTSGPRVVINGGGSSTRYAKSIEVSGVLYNCLTAELGEYTIDNKKKSLVLTLE